MNRSELYYHSVDVLLDAYNDKKLKHGDCTACAVGNLVGDGMKKLGKSYTMDDLERMGSRITLRTWTRLFVTSRPGHSRQFISKIPEKILGKDSVIRTHVECTGYHWKELARIEKAFESISKKTVRSENETLMQFEGLCKVLDVLKEIHQVDQEVSSVSSERLQKIYKNKHERVCPYE